VVSCPTVSVRATFAALSCWFSALIVSTLLLSDAISSFCCSIVAVYSCSCRSAAALRSATVCLADSSWARSREFRLLDRLSRAEVESSLASLSFSRPMTSLILPSAATRSCVAPEAVF